MGGGPSAAQNAAAASQAKLTDQSAQTSREMLDFYKQQQGKIDPFATSRLNNGLPFANAMSDASNGTIARSFAPLYAQQNRRFSGFGALPSGFREQARTDLDAQRARAFDQGQIQNLLTNEQAKTQGAQMLTGQQQLANPLGWNQSAMGGNSSIMNAPLQSPGLGGLIGGIAGGAMSAIPF